MTFSALAHPSPNFNARKEGIPLAFIVIHYTDMTSTEAALTRLCDPASSVSSHYLIGTDGAIYSLVDETKRAWHAGVSCWHDIRDINSASVGIELANPGHTNGYEPFPAPQIAALTELLADIIARHNLNPRTCLLAHSDIAPLRKKDPGELFPWQSLAEKGFGFWPAPPDNDARDITQAQAATLLHAIGYDITPDAHETMFTATLAAFQRRFRPSFISGKLDAETAACLHAAARLAKTK